MLQNKDIAKIQEIKTLFKDRWTEPEFFLKHLDLFHFSKSSKIFKAVKKKWFSILEYYQGTIDSAIYKYKKYLLFVQ